MISPLSKRFPRMLVHSAGRYISIFLLISVVIALISGFLVAASSIEKIFDEMHETYSIEDGRFEVEDKLTSSQVDKVEKEGVTLYENFSHDTEYVASDDAVVTMRVYKNRTEIDRAAIHEGDLPKDKQEIAIDQTFAMNRDLSVGDTIDLGGRDYRISGLVVLSDYSALFKSNSDFMMDATTFCVCVVTDEGFDRLKKEPISYTYSFVFDDQNLEVSDRTDIESDIIEVLQDEDASVLDMIDGLENQGINYAGEDISHDQTIYEILLILIIVIMGFVFVVVTNGVIESESSAIGTLLASGYTNGELVRHYVFMPAFVGVIACIIGNVLGYTVFSEPMRGLYYNSYSFPPYVGIFNVRVFVITTVVPLVMLIAISVWGIARKLRCTPLQFLRRDIVHRSKRHTVKLPSSWGYSTRFRARVFLRSLPQFATLFAGIAFTSLLLVFGLALLPVMQNYASTLEQTMPAEHIYTLKAPYELEMTKEQKDVRKEIAQLKQMEEALERVEEGGDRLNEGGTQLGESLDQLDSGAETLSDSVNGPLSTGVETMAEGSSTYSDALDSSAKSQSKKSKEIDLKDAQEKYAAALKSYLQASATALAMGANPETDQTTLAAYASMEKALTSLLTKAAEKGGYTAAAQALEQASKSYKKLDEGMQEMDSSVGDLGKGTSELSEGTAAISEGFDEYAEGVTSYTTAIERLLDSAKEMLDDDDATSDLEDRYHVVAKKGRNSKSAIESAEKIAVGQLEIARAHGDSKETVTVYGIEEGSRYWSDIDVSDDKVVAGAGLAEKCTAQPREVAVFYDKYHDNNYALEISAQTSNRTDTNVYMSIDMFNDLFDNEKHYFNGYASDEALNINSDYLASHLTPDDMKKIGTQMTDSMGEVIQFVVFLAVFVFFIMVYLLTKTTIEHSARSISYMKVFGYKDGEINRLYIRSITWTVILSLLVSLPLVSWSVIKLCEIILVEYSGNFVIDVPAYVLAQDLALGFIAYLVVAFLHIRNIRKIPFTEALKVTE